MLSFFHVQLTDVDCVLFFILLTATHRADSNFQSSGSEVASAHPLSCNFGRSTPRQLTHATLPLAGLQQPLCLAACFSRIFLAKNLFGCLELSPECNRNDHARNNRSRISQLVCPEERCLVFLEDLCDEAGICIHLQTGPYEPASLASYFCYECLPSSRCAFLLKRCQSLINLYA